jgi:hypothetical protein
MIHSGRTVEISTRESVSNIQFNSEDIYHKPYCSSMQMDKSVRKRGQHICILK